MNRRIFLQFSGPVAIIGLFLFGGSMASVWSIQRLQENLTTILADNVTSLIAAQQIEIKLRQLRFHTFVYVIDPTPERQKEIDQDVVGFEDALRLAKENVTSEEERQLVQGIETGYGRFREELKDQLPPASASLLEFARWADRHPVRHIRQQCQDLLDLNKSAMEATARESESVGRQTRTAILFLGILGPISGLVVGYGISRSWSRSMTQLSVRLQDVHSHLERDVADVKLEVGQTWSDIDRQLDRVVVRVKEAAEQLQRHQRELLRAEQLAAVGQLAASVAHEIRNPLTSIKILIGMALRRQSTEVLTREDLNVIYDEIGKLEHTVQTLLDYARPTKIQRTQIDLRQVLSQATTLVRPKAQQQNIEIRESIPAVPVLGAIDSVQMGQVAVNLLLNAIDALPQGGAIEVSLEDAGLNDFRITVSDNGPGIAEEMIPRLFDPFASTKTTGTGLGLSISQRIVGEHGGTIDYSARPGSGARFVVTAPKFSPEVDHATPACD